MASPIITKKYGLPNGVVDGALPGDQGCTTRARLRKVTAKQVTHKAGCAKRPNARYLQTGRLGGVVVSVLATGPNGRGFEPSQGDGFLKALKIRSTPSFGREVKPEVPCRKILRHEKRSLEVPRGRID
jgi:hypothetical protein